MKQQSERITDITATLEEFSVSSSQVAQNSSTVLNIAETNQEESENGIKQSTQSIDDPAKVTTELSVFADQLNQMVTELQDENGRKENL